MRDVRGFAVKLYTNQGNWDSVRNNIPVFFIQDAIKFPDIIHAAKPSPTGRVHRRSRRTIPSGIFVSLTPESMHMIMWVMSDRAIPKILPLWTPQGGDDLAGNIANKNVLDAAIIASAQAVEHYEIARYGALIAWARQIGRGDFADILEANLEEEKAADDKLNTIAESRVNAKAAGRPGASRKTSAARRKPAATQRAGRKAA